MHCINEHPKHMLKLMGNLRKYLQFYAQNFVYLLNSILNLCLGKVCVRWLEHMFTHRSRLANYLSIKLLYPFKHVLGTQKNQLNEMVLLSSINICFGGGIRKLILLPLLLWSLF